MGNTVSGTVHGAIVQAGVVHGGVHIHPQAPEVVPRQLPLEVATFNGGATNSTSWKRRWTRVDDAQLP
ncbi:hypothetical protein [Nocardia sp. NRRL S-836]|uniref:hypothetical protein n=1 Tax=Nocardia sp. NRRL S-836 TaxID=1519492 RepID=UPI0006ADCD80|nr:hypothetical protein [Nocardia sp. NRRL S-836]KOV80789.1 hypothetical protein ADL03_31715 [Nocardia sp. NRRL S-836]